MLKQDPNAVLPDHYLPKKAVIQSPRQARVFTTAPCIGLQRKKREEKSRKME